MRKVYLKLTRVSPGLAPTEKLVHFQELHTVPAIYAPIEYVFGQKLLVTLHEEREDGTVQVELPTTAAPFRCRVPHWAIEELPC